jgi:hypothetical protein
MFTVTGTARDAALGAVVLRDDGVAIFIDGLGSWPADLHGKRVEATGKLVRKSLSPEPEVGPGGERSAGMSGDAQVLEGATWKLVP